MSYPTTKISRMGGDSVRALTDIPEMLSLHNVTIPKDVIAAIEKHATVLDHIKSIENGTDPGTAHDSAARAVADGMGTAEQVTTAAAAQMVAARSPQSPYRLILSKARDYAATDLQKAFAAHGDDWITKILRPAIDKAVTVITKETQYAPAYDAFTDPAAANHWTTNPRVSEAWTKLRDLYSVARTLRRYRITSATQRSDDLFEWTGEGEYNTKRGGEHLQASVRDNMRDGNLTWFLMAMQSGMTPTLLTEAELSASK